MDKLKASDVCKEQIEENIKPDFTGQVTIMINCRQGSIANIATEVKKKKEYT